MALSLVVGLSFLGQNKAQNPIHQIDPGFSITGGKSKWELIWNEQHWCSNGSFLIERTPRGDEAWCLVDEANVAWERGDHVAAITKWYAIAEEYPETEAALAALSNLGNACFETGDESEAICAFAYLVDLPGSDQIDLPWSLRNYRHHACVKIADIYEKQGDYSCALPFLELARGKHIGFHVCYMGVECVRNEIDSRINRLMTLIQSEES